MMPIVTSGWPNLAVSTASRIVQAIASSQPPPRAKPLTAATTGLPRFSMTLVRRCPCRVLSSASAGVSLAISAMSAPAAHCGIIAGVLEDFVQLRDGGLVERVEHLGSVECHIGDRSLFLVQNVLAR